MPNQFDASRAYEDSTVDAGRQNQRVEMSDGLTVTDPSGNKINLVTDANGYIILNSSDLVTQTNRVIDVEAKATVAVLQDDSITADETKYLAVGDYRSVLVSYVCSAATPSLTVGMSPQKDGTAASSCNYIDITQDGIDILDGTTAATAYTDTVGFRVNVSDAEYLELAITGITTETCMLFVTGDKK